MLMVVTALAMFLRWSSDSTGDTETGVALNDGQLALGVSVLTIALVQVGLRPAWIGAGFVAAMLGRRALDISNSTNIDVGIGLVLGAVAATVAALLLIWDMFANVERNPINED